MSNCLGNRASCGYSYLIDLFDVILRMIWMQLEKGIFAWTSTLSVLSYLTYNLDSFAVNIYSKFSSANKKQWGYLCLLTCYDELFQIFWEIQQALYFSSFSLTIREMKEFRASNFWSVLLLISFNNDSLKIN